MLHVRNEEYDNYMYVFLFIFLHFGKSAKIIDFLSI